MLPQSLKSLLMATAICGPALTILSTPVVSYAQAASYSVPSQDMKTALQTLGNLSGRELEFSEADVVGKTSKAVVNAISFNAALDAMLTGTNLVVSAQPDGTVVVSTASAKTSGAVSTVVVTGRRMTSNAANLQVDAVNTVTVLTPTDLARTPDQNVAESLSRIPGVTALNGGFGNTNGVAIDQAGRGTANFVEIRGMDSEFNTDTINGVDVAQGKPYSRQVQLDLLPPTGLQKIVVNKTIGADMDGDAIGGSIDFQTANAYDFSGSTHGSLVLGGQVEDRALDYGRNPLGGNIAFDFARKFGDHDQFGLYFAGYYDRQNFTNSIVDGVYPAQINGMYTYALQTASGASAAPGDASKNLVLTGLDVGLTTGFNERYGGNVSLDWRPNTNLSGYARFTYATDYIDQETSYDQIYGNKISKQEVGTTGLYTPLIANIQPRYYFETNPEAARLGTFQVGGDAQFGRLHVAPNIFASYGEDDEPNHIELSARLPEEAAGFPYGGSSLFTAGAQGPVPIVSASQQAAIANVAGYGARRSGEYSPEFSRQMKTGAKIDGVYDVKNGWLDTISAGLKYEDSYRHHTYRDYETGKLFTTDANDPTFGSLGLINGSVSAIVPGVYEFPTPTINLTNVFNLFNAAAAKEGGLAAISDQCGGGYVNSYNCDTQSGIEDTTSVYLQAKLKFDQIEVIPGFRFEHTDITNRYWNQSPGLFTSNKSKYNEPLPSLFINYRPNDLTVYRASVTQTYVLPSMFQLGGGEQISTSDTGTTITIGNPNLKAIGSVNLDASGEWLNTHGTAVEVAVFYKRLDHFIYDSINSFTNATQSAVGDVFTTEPENGGAGKVYGLELSGRQKFQEMPTPLDGFGVAGNVTLEGSSVNTKAPGLNPDERLQDQPDLSANAQLFYDKGPYQMDLSYRYIGRYVSAYGTLGPNSDLDTWVQANTRLDLHLGYMTPWQIHLDVSIANLFDSDSYVETIGKNSYVIPSYVNSGRTYMFKAGYHF